MPVSAPPFENPDWNAFTAASLTGEYRIDDESVLTLASTAGDIQISFSDFGMRLQAGDSSGPTYPILVTKPEPYDLSIKEKDWGLTVSARQYVLEVELDPFSFRLYRDGHPVQQSATDGYFTRTHRLPPLGRTEQGWILSLELDPEEGIYGLGEKWGSLNHRGQLLRSYNEDALGVNAEASYKNTPFTWSTEGWGLLAHTPATVTHAIGHPSWSQRAYALAIDDEALDIFLFAEPSPAALIERYCKLTGFADTPPDWSLGVILSKAYYKDADELLSVAREVRERDMPCDTITLDGRAWQDTATRFAFEWDATRYPDPGRVIDELKALDFKVCIWEYPLVSTAHPLHQEMADKGWLLKDARTGEPYRYEWDTSPFGNVLTPLPDSGIVDFTHPDAYAFWRDAHKPLFDLGIDMIKADFGEQITDDHMLAHNGDRGMLLHNVYSLLYNQCVYEAAKRYSKTGAFLFSRSGWTGSQRFPSLWGGDPQADWQGLAASIRGALSWGLSGGPYYATDIGGFYRDTRDAELYVRWAQAAVFAAHYRLHGIGPREPWSYGPEAEEAVNKALKLRYQLLPYLYEAMQESSRSGLPVQRAMALAFPEDSLSWSFEHQFLLGDRLLVVPCFRPGGKIRYYLPEGEWLRFPSGELQRGGAVVDETLALDEMALFVRAGQSLPLGNAENWKQQTVSGPITQWPTGSTS